MNVFHAFRHLLAWVPGVALACCSVAVCAADNATASLGVPVHQILVMLHLPPPHFRPDANYAGGYGDDISRNARRRIAAQLAETHGLKLVGDWPMPVLGIDCFVMEEQANEQANASPERTAEILSRDRRVEWAQPMNAFHALARNDPLYPLQPGATAWHLAELHKVATGRHVRVAVIDSGVEDGHPDLAGQVVFKENFVDGKPDGSETHGTAVAGIIGARAGNGIGIEGVAPDAQLMVLRACWQESDDVTQCNSFTLGKALNAAIMRDAHVINLSLTGPSDHLLQRLLDAALVRGIKVIGAVDPHSANGGFPASHPGVLAVTDDISNQAADRGANGAANGATTGKIAASVLIAPGRDIPTTAPGARWAFVSGTSFAAAHVSGLVTLLTELRPSLKPFQLREELVINSVDTRTAGTVDACAAMMRTTGTYPCSGARAHAATANQSP